MARYPVLDVHIPEHRHEGGRRWLGHPLLAGVQPSPPGGSGDPSLTEHVQKRTILPLLPFKPIHYHTDFSPMFVTVVIFLSVVYQDGNLGILMDELNSGQLLDLDEPSNGSIPYTPLFLAYINDHIQVGGVV